MKQSTPTPQPQPPQFLRIGTHVIGTRYLVSVEFTPGADMAFIHLAGELSSIVIADRVQVAALDKFFGGEVEA